MGVNYPIRTVHGHPNAKRRGNVPLHTLIAEKAFGRYLPKTAVVHHVDGNPYNNMPSNLVVCQDKAYHQLLHTRENALKATGNPNLRKCRICKKYDSVSNLRISGGFYHVACQAIYDRVRYENRY